jgi:hypothetical protein
MLRPEHSPPLRQESPNSPALSGPTPQALMPLARIITNAVEESLELTIQLRARGFQVETVAPGKVPATPADLEVRLDECDSADVTSCISESDSSENLWVYFAPGALDDRARPVRVISLVPPVEKDHFSPVAKPATAPAFRPEDDPILAELEGDVILSELDASSSQRPAVAPLEVEVPPEDHRGRPLSASASVLAAAGSAPASLEKAIDSRSPIAKTPKQSEFWIPQVPERPSPQFSLVATASPREPRLAVVRISLQTGPRFWRKAFASCALVILGTAVAIIVGTRPPLPAVAIQPASARSPQSLESTSEHSQNVVRPTVATNAKAVQRNHQISAASVVKQDAQVFTDQPPKQAHRARSAHDDIIAEDTVVFYDRSHGVASKAIPQSKPRRYSDQN